MAHLPRLRLDRVARRDARAAHRRQHAGGEAAQHRDRRAEEEDAPVKTGVEIDDRGAAGKHRQQQVAAPGRRQQAERAAHTRQQQVLDEQLANDAPAPGAHRAAHGNLPLARARPRHQQAGHVSAGDQQQHADHGQQHEQPRRRDRRAGTTRRVPRSRARCARVARARDRRRSATRAVRPRRADAGRWRRRFTVAASAAFGTRRYTGSHSIGGLQHPRLGAVGIVRHAGVERVADVALHRHRNPDLGVPQRDDRTEEPGSATPITVRVAPPTISSLADNLRIAIETALPVRVADHHHGMRAGRGVVARLDQPARPAGAGRSTSKNSPETSCTMLRSAAAASVRRGRRTCMLVGLVAAKSSARPWSLLADLFEQRPRVAIGDIARGDAFRRHRAVAGSGPAAHAGRPRSAR